MNVHNLVGAYRQAQQDLLSQKDTMLLLALLDEWIEALKDAMQDMLTKTDPELRVHLQEAQELRDKLKSHLG